MNRVPDWKMTAVGALAGTTLLTAVAALLALTVQRGPLMWSDSLGFSETHDKRAFRMVDAAATPAGLDAAAREAERAIRLAPYNNAARLRLAYLDTLKRHRLEGPGLKDYADSYNLIPYDHTVASWRIAFGLEHWDQLTPELRMSVHEEARAFARSHSQDVDVVQIIQSIHNPEGKLAASLWLREFAS